MSFFGKYRGRVVDVADPERLMRLKAVVPDVLGTEASSWAMPCVPVAAVQSGIVCVPSVGAGVWIEFEQGDADYPIWSGCWWGAVADVPTIAVTDGPASGELTVVTPGQQVLSLSDAPAPAGGVLLKTAGGAQVHLSEQGIVIDNGHGARIALVGPKVQMTGLT